MCRRNIRESLTARIFLLTLLLLLGAGGLTFGLIAWATPITYVSVVGDRLQVQVSELTDRLALTKLADAGPILDVFVRESGAAVSLASPDGESVDTGSLYVSVTTAVQESDSVSTYTYGADGGPAAGFHLKALPQRLDLRLEIALCHPRADDDKFVPADSVEISSLKRLPHPPGAFHQYLISKCVASQIIDILQAVDIQIYDAHRGIRNSQVIRIGSIPVTVVEGGQGVMIAEPV